MLTREKRAEILAHYCQSGNYTKTAAAFDVSPNTVRSIALKHRQTTEVQTDGSNAGSTDLSDFDSRDGEVLQDDRTEKVGLIIDRYLDALLLPEKISAASVNQLSTVLGAVMDRFLKEDDKGKKSVSVSFKDIPGEWLR